MENQNNRQQEIDKEPDSTNSEDFLEYFDLSHTCSIKKKFENLPEQQEWDHKINLMEDFRN